MINLEITKSKVLKNNMQNVKVRGREDDTNIYPGSPCQLKDTSRLSIYLEDFSLCIKIFSYKAHTKNPLKIILNTHIRNRVTSLFIQQTENTMVDFEPPRLKELFPKSPNIMMIFIIHYGEISNIQFC